MKNVDEVLHQLETELEQIKGRISAYYAGIRQSHRERTDKIFLRMGVGEPHTDGAAALPPFFFSSTKEPTS